MFPASVINGCVVLLQSTALCFQRLSSMVVLFSCSQQPRVSRVCHQWLCYSLAVNSLVFPASVINGCVVLLQSTASCFPRLSSMVVLFSCSQQPCVSRVCHQWLCCSLAVNSLVFPASVINGCVVLLQSTALCFPRLSSMVVLFSCSQQPCVSRVCHQWLCCSLAVNSLVFPASVINGCVVLLQLTALCFPRLSSMVVLFSCSQQPCVSRVCHQWLCCSLAVNSLVFPASVINGVAVSKTFQIIYRGEDVTLNDIVLFKVPMLVDSLKVLLSRVASPVAGNTLYTCPVYDVELHPTAIVVHLLPCRFCLIRQRLACNKTNLQLQLTWLLAPV